MQNPILTVKLTGPSLLYCIHCAISAPWRAKLTLHQAKYRIEAITRYARQNGNFRSIRIADQCVYARVLMALKSRYICPYASKIVSAESSLQVHRVQGLSIGQREGGKEGGREEERKEKSGISMSS